MITRSTAEVFILVLGTCLMLSCSEESSDRKNEHTTSDDSMEESPFMQQAVVCFDIYKSGDPVKALQAMHDDVVHITNAKESDLSPFWKNQALAFSKARIYMILDYTGKHEEAQGNLQSALDHINLWLREGGREQIDEKQLIRNVVAADKAHKDLPWHPQID